MRQNKFKRFLLMITILVCTLSGCKPIVEEAEKNLTIYSSFYPIYALTSLVTRDVPDMTIHCLVEPQDGCLRDYQISDRDLYLLAYSADAVVLAGSGLESFADALTSESNTQIAALKLLEGLDLYQGHSDEDESHFEGANPYLYLSIDGAIRMIENAESGLSVLDPDYEELYHKNANRAIEELTALRDELLAKASILNGKRAAILAEPLFYVAKMYGMDAVCTVERECGQALYGSEIDDCLNALAEAQVDVVLIEKQAPLKLVNAISDAGYAVAKIDCMNTHTEKEGAEGYFAAHRANANALIEAIKGE